MPTDPRLITPDVRRTANRLLDVLQRTRVADGAAAPNPSSLGQHEIHASPALIEQAKGALMLRFGIDSHQAFGVLVGWARMSRTPVPTIAHTLLRGICEGDPQTKVRQRALVRWLGDSFATAILATYISGRRPARCEPAHETPRSG